MGQCKCTNPPGGQTNCPEGHAAVCRKIDGLCHGECHHVNLNLKREQVLNYVIRIITEDFSRDLNAPLTDQEHFFLRAGSHEYFSSGKRVEVTFYLPFDVDDYLDSNLAPETTVLY